MCGQFELPGQDMEACCAEIDRKYAGYPLPAPWRRQGTVRPGDILPVIARGKNGKTGFFLMRWGFSGGEKGLTLINARSETADKKATFAAAFQSRRCLIPAARYYEWQRTGTDRQKFSLTPAAEPPFFLAGLYRYEADRRLPAFVVLTRAAENDIAFIHNRMPVLLSGQAAENWLSPHEDPSALLSQALRVMNAATQRSGEE